MKRISCITLTILLLAAGCSGSQALIDAAVQLTGAWNIEELITQASGVCSDSVGDTSSYTLQIVQNGNELIITVGSDAPENAGAIFTGTISGNTIDWQGNYPTNGGTTEVTSTNITATDNDFNGTANWNWSDGNDSCSGTTQVQGTKS